MGPRVSRTRSPLTQAEQRQKRPVRERKHLVEGRQGETEPQLRCSMQLLSMLAAQHAMRWEMSATEPVESPSPSRSTARSTIGGCNVCIVAVAHRHTPHQKSGHAGVLLRRVHDHRARQGRPAARSEWVKVGGRSGTANNHRHARQQGATLEASSHVRARAPAGAWVTPSPTQGRWQAAAAASSRCRAGSSRGR